MKNKKNVNNKRESVSRYTFPVLQTHNEMFIFLTNDKPVTKIMQCRIIFLVLVHVKKYILHID